MSAQHTPGPWHYSKGGRAHAESGALLASAWHPEQMPDANDERQLGESWLDARDRLAPERDRIEAEMEANARLISAAPELLDCLENLFATVMGECRQLLDEDSGGNSALYMQIKAAIAKATGAQP